jgi:hypothetical protein
MRTHLIRKFAARYHAGPGLETPLTRFPVPAAVASARTFLAGLGLAFVIAGIAVAWTFDHVTGLAVFVIGAFLLILPFTGAREDE